MQTESVGRGSFQKKKVRISPILYHLLWDPGRGVQDCPYLASSQNVTGVDSRDRSFSHKIPFVDFGLRILASSNFEAVANDKDGGRYTFVDPEVLSMIHVQLLGNDQCSNLIGRAWTMGYMQAASTYINLTKRVESLETEESLSRSLCQSFYMPGSSLTVQLITSCKSHKPPRSVKFLNIHSAPCHSFAGLASWSGKQHRIQTSRLKNLHKDTRHVIQQISEMPGHYLVRRTLRSFLMSGENECLAWTQLVYPTRIRRKPLIHDVDRFLLEYLFVTRRLPDRLWRVKKNSERIRVICPMLRLQSLSKPGASCLKS